MSTDRDIKQRLYCISSLPKGNYELEIVPPRPLSFDRVNEGKAPVSQALLFKLPLEITGQILEKVPWSSLASLALVCRDCRQLARSRQFASIKLDYRHNSKALVNKLMAEGSIRSGSYGGSNNMSQSLGVCIRRITVAIYPHFFKTRDQRKFDELPDAQKNKRLDDAKKTFVGGSIPTVEYLLGSTMVLPNLEFLDWRDKNDFSRSFFERLPLTSIQHLRLSHVRIPGALISDLPKQPRVWPLRTLYLEIHPSFRTAYDHTSLICASILRFCASTLESLTWRTLPLYGTEDPFATYEMGPSPQFPRLRSLKLQTETFPDRSLLDALLGDGLRDLEVDIGHNTLSKILEEHGTIATLTTLVWDGNIKSNQTLSFLRANTQLSKLSLPWGGSGIFLGTQLLPLLNQSFRQLTSLSLRWESDWIPHSALGAVGSLGSLQQLHLSAGIQHGRKHNWFIDHDMVRSRLKHLTSLKRMAFSRDTYDPPFVELLDRQAYYIDRSWAFVEWEDWHRDCTPNIDKLCHSD